jgi:PAS domain S-box-containing protein
MYINGGNKSRPANFKITSFERTVYFSFALILIVLVIIFYLLRSNYNKLKESGKWIEQTREILYQSEKVNELYKSLISESRGFIITGWPDFNRAFSNDTTRVKAAINSLEDLSHDNPAQQDRLKKLDTIIKRRILFARQTVVLRNEKGFAESKRLIESGGGVALSGRIDQLIRLVQAEEQRLLNDRLSANERSSRNTSHIMWLLVVTLVLLIVMVIYIVISTLRTRTRIARELSESEAWLSKTLAGIADGIIATDTRGNISFLNPAAGNLTGWSGAEASGKKIEDVFHIIEENSGTKMLNPVREVLRNKTVAELQPNSILIKKDGTQVAIDHSAAPITDENGNFIGVVLVLRDVGPERYAAKMLEQKVEERTEAVVRSEKKYRDILDNMLEGVQMIDRAWRYIYVNESLAKQARYPASELVGHTIMEKYPRIENSELFKVLRECMSERKARVFENKFTFPDGSEGYFELSIQPVPEGLSILSIDISVRKKAELELQELAASLEKKVEARTAQLSAVNAELESFSYSVSHDLRAPLRAISGFSTILSEDYGSRLDDEGKRVVSIIQDNVKQMGQLINDLLMLAKMGKQELQKNEVDMNALVKGIIDEQKVNNNLKAEIIVKPLDKVFADESLLRQVVTNLFSNAVKYSSKNEKAVIEIGSSLKNDAAVFYVKDNGVGFNMDYYSKLFGVFQRLHNPKDFQGSGVGLAIVKRIVNRHGGQVWAEAKEGGGATFYFSIPVKNALL